MHLGTTGPAAGRGRADLLEAGGDPVGDVAVPAPPGVVPHLTEEGRRDGADIRLLQNRLPQSPPLRRQTGKIGRFLELSPLPQGPPELVLRGKVIGIDLEGPTVGRLRLGRLVALGMDPSLEAPEAVVRLRLRRRLAEEPRHVVDVAAGGRLLEEVGEELEVAGEAVEELLEPPIVFGNLSFLSIPIPIPLLAPRDVLLQTAVADKPAGGSDEKQFVVGRGLEPMALTAEVDLNASMSS